MRVYQLFNDLTDAFSPAKHEKKERGPCWRSQRTNEAFSILSRRCQRCADENIEGVPSRFIDLATNNGISARPQGARILYGPRGVALQPSGLMMLRARHQREARTLLGGRRMMMSPYEYQARLR